MKSAALIATLVLAASSGAALAHSNDVRQREQNAWIESGRNNGTITWREGKKLRREQAAIGRIEADMMKRHAIAQSSLLGKGFVTIGIGAPQLKITMCNSERISTFIKQLC